MTKYLQFPLATRSSKNPILTPTDNDWENKAVFNCASIFLPQENKTILLYRAIGDDKKSRLGYAECRNDEIIYRSPHPILYESCEAETLGLEDPRITQINNIYYITYVAVCLDPNSEVKNPYQEGANWKIRTHLASTKDFKTFEKLGCMLDITNKDIVLFPEKINGKFMMMHRIFPDIWLAESDNLIHWENHQKIFSVGEPGTWDCNRIGAGAPPIKIKEGWLNFYHGVDDNIIYSLGIFISALNDPSEILYRSANPILTPEEQYEKDGLVPNVVFTCGAIQCTEEKFGIYYGGADKSIGYAEYIHEILKETTDNI